MPPETRSGEKTERNESIINFLKSSEFLDLIQEIIKSETSALREEIASLRGEVQIIRESNVELLKLLTSQPGNFNIKSKNSQAESIERKTTEKMTFAEKVSSNKKENKKSSEKKNRSV